MEAASSSIRSALTASPGKKLVASDLSNIEGRFLAWLAGEEKKLQAFRDYDAGTGHDLYKITAGGILGKRPEDVTKDERQVSGKVPELACGFGGAVGAFQSMARLYGLEMSDARALDIVKGWRKNNPNIVSLWHDLEEAAVLAVSSPGRRFECRRLVLQRDGSWLRIRLPSGRCLCYPGVRVEDGKLTYMGVNQYTRKWERIPTYGGKLSENATQAGARDVIAHQMPEVEAAGFEIVLTVHDEIVCEAALDNPSLTSHYLSSLMSAVPPWAQGLPLAAEGYEAQRYRK